VQSHPHHTTATADRCLAHHGHVRTLTTCVQTRVECSHAPCDLSTNDASPLLVELGHFGHNCTLNIAKARYALNRVVVLECAASICTATTTSATPTSATPASAVHQAVTTPRRSEECAKSPCVRCNNLDVFVKLAAFRRLRLSLLVVPADISVRVVRCSIVIVLNNVRNAGW
jgi:hypothetical protein